MKYDYFGKDHLLLSCYEEMYTVMSNWIRFIDFNYMKMVSGLQCEFADRDKSLLVLRKYMYRPFEDINDLEIKRGDAPMKPNELIVEGYYVREERSLILHFYSAGSDGLARYHAYDLGNGKYRQTGSCALGTMLIWTDRKATTEEISRVQPREPVVEVFERGSSPLRQALKSSSGSRFDY